MAERAATVVGADLQAMIARDETLYDTSLQA